MGDTNQLRQRIAEELGLRPSNLINWRGSDITVGYAVNREINSAIDHYETTRFRWNEIREQEFATTVDGTKAYSLPAGLVKLDSLKVIYSGSYIDQKKRSWSEIEERHRDVSGGQGTPYEYAIYGNVIRLYPVPNQALTLVASYMIRPLPTSLTGSYCAIQTLGGGSLTATSTASHNNRLDGWVTDGEALLRARACASVAINYLRDETAIREATRLANTEFLSVREKQAYSRLHDETTDFLATGSVRPYEI